MVDKRVEEKAVPRAGLALVLAFGAALSVPRDAAALPLFARESGDRCTACHADGKATDKIGGFVPGLSVNGAGVAAAGPFSRAPSYVPLSVLMNSRFGDYGGSLSVGDAGRGAELGDLTVHGFWLPTPRLQLGARYTLYSRPDAAAQPDGSYGGAWRPNAGTLFFYLRSVY